MPGAASYRFAVRDRAAAGALTEALAALGFPQVSACPLARARHDAGQPALALGGHRRYGQPAGGLGARFWLAISRAASR